MKLWRNGILIVILAVLVLSNISVSAESDPTGDIWHQTWSENKWTWGTYGGSKPNIDITDISYSIATSEATLTMTVAGSIVDNISIGYFMHLRTSEESYYQVYYRDGIGLFWGFGDYSGIYEVIESPPISGDGKSLTYTFNVSDPDLDYEAWGYASEYDEFGVEDGEIWSDYAPGSFAPWYTGEEEITCYRCNPQTGELESDIFEGDECPTGWQASPPDCEDETSGENGNDNGGGDGDGTPGFEALALIAAVAIALIILRRRK